MSNESQGDATPAIRIRNSAALNSLTVCSVCACCVSLLCCDTDYVCQSLGESVRELKQSAFRTINYP